MTVSQLNRYVSSKISFDAKLKGIMVKGELSGISYYSKANMIFFTLKDSESLINGVMYSSSLGRLKFTPEEGMSVIVTGDLTVYEKMGRYQIKAVDMTPLGVGAAADDLQKLKERLAKAGVFSQEHKKPIPLVPKSIAVVTSVTGAVIEDIKNVCSRRYPLVRLMIYPAQVQGEYAAATICRALAKADKSGADTVIIARGGGSAEDLSPFNSEEIAMAVYNCRTPIISAVGHETDTTLCDYAADLRAPTPSAAAELAVPDKQDIINALAVMKNRLDKACDNLLEKSTAEVERLKDKLSIHSPAVSVEKNWVMINNLYSRLNKAAENIIERKSSAFDNAAGRLNALSPFNVLGRGYAIVQRSGKTVDDANALNAGDKVDIRFAQGNAKAEITNVYAKEN